MADTFQPIGAVAVNLARRRKPLFQSAKHAVSFFARSAAKQAVKEQMRDQGRRMTLVPVSEIAAQAEVYLAQHPELYAQALERAKQLGFVEALPIHVTPEYGQSRPDPYTYNAEAGTDKSG